MTDTSPLANDPHPETAHLAYATATDLAASLKAGSTTSVALTAALLERIEAIERPAGVLAGVQAGVQAGEEGGVGLGAVLAVSLHALDEAAALDAERAAGTTRGPLHGVPVLVKDNIEAVGLPGTAGSLALGGRDVVRDSPLVAALRAAGLVVLGATNLSEWANLRSPHSTSGWSALGGLTGNPWALDRSAGGSSSGSGAAVAGGLAPLAIGTETDGSITCPSSLTGVVGLKPTVGLLPTVGVVPLSGSQDSPGPMARTVRDVALLLDALTGSSRYASGVDASRGLAGLRLGVARGWYTEHPGTDGLFEQSLTRFEAAGAVLSTAEVTPLGGVGADELTVLLYEMKDDLDGYLAGRSGDGVRSLAEVVEFNRANSDRELAHFGQEFLEQSLTTGGRTDPGYAEARARCLAWAVDLTLQPAFDAGVDLLLAPAYGPAWKSDLVGGDRFSGGLASAAPSIAGWPVLCLPMGLVDGLPVGLVLIARPDSEESLLAAGHAVERAIGLDDSFHPRWTPPTRV